MKYDREAYAELRKGIAINRDMLDEELIANAQSFHHAGEGFAFAKSRRDTLEARLARLHAELDNDIRENMVSQNEKFTETQIKQKILQEKDYRKLHDDFLSACREADSWEGLRNSFRQRADMLKALVQLHVTGYFGEMTGASERRDARERFGERSSERDERPWRSNRHQDPRHDN